MPEIIFNGPSGRLEGRYQHSREPGAPIALVLHPDPRYGGTMNNKVVYNVFHAFAQRGYSVLRFNFRGVGRSQGGFDNGQGELADAAAALDWMQTYNPNATACWIAGFSFGAWIGMQLLMRRPEISAFISVAPPANMYDFTFLAPCPASGMILHGSDDQLVPEADVVKLSDRLANQKGIKVAFQSIKGASHFFEDHMPQLTSTVGSYIDANMVTPPEA